MKRSRKLEVRGGFSQLGYSVSIKYNGEKLEIPLCNDDFERVKEDDSELCKGLYTINNFIKQTANAEISKEIRDENKYAFSEMDIMCSPAFYEDGKFILSYKLIYATRSTNEELDIDESVYS